MFFLLSVLGSEFEVFFLECSVKLFVKYSVFTGGKTFEIHPVCSCSFVFIRE